MNLLAALRELRLWLQLKEKVMGQRKLAGVDRIIQQATAWDTPTVRRWKIHNRRDAVRYARTENVTLNNAFLELLRAELEVTEETEG